MLKIMEDNNILDIDNLFREAMGKPVEINGKSLVRLDRFDLPIKKISLNFSFIKTNSEWRQGFILKTKGNFKIEGLDEIQGTIIFWEDTAPKDFVVNVNSKDQKLLIYNVWDLGNGVTQAWHNGAAIEIKQITENKRVYYCNDGHPSLSLDNLIFNMSWQVPPASPRIG